MIYWEFTQFDTLVDEKHLGLQGLKWEGISIRHGKLIKLDQKFDEIGDQRDQNRIRLLVFAVIANIRPQMFSYAIIS